MVVVADSSPLRYLILIEEIDLLPALFGSIVIPPAVVGELTHPSTPMEAHAWMSRLPNWVTVKTPRVPLYGAVAILGRGEREAIALAEELGADALLADDEQARQESLRRSIPVQGTLGILNLGAEHGLVTDFVGALTRLRGTNFRISGTLLEYFLNLDRGRKRIRD